MLLSVAPTIAMAWVIRVAAPHELARVAELQFDTFAPPPESPALLPLLASFYERSQASVRGNMLRKLMDELNSRIDTGSDVFVAAEADDDALPSGGVDESGRYVEKGAPLLGTVDLSQQEMQLPTHGIAEGLYMSCMAVAPAARRRGIARALLAASEARALERGESMLWLHVEAGNHAAISLYEREGFLRQPDTPLFQVVFVHSVRNLACSCGAPPSTRSTGFHHPSRHNEQRHSSHAVAHGADGRSDLDAQPGLAGRAQQGHGLGQLAFALQSAGARRQRGVPAGRVADCVHGAARAIGAPPAMDGSAGQLHGHGVVACADAEAGQCRGRCGRGAGDRH